MNRSMTAFGCALVLASGSAAAAGSSMNPGLWEYNVKMEMSGIPVAIPPTTYNHCVTKEEASKAQTYDEKQNQNKDCVLKNQSHSGDKSSYDIVCTGPIPSTAHFDQTLTANAFESVSTTNLGNNQKAKQTIKARRLGECK